MPKQETTILAKLASTEPQRISSSFAAYSPAISEGFHGKAGAGNSKLYTAFIGALVGIVSGLAVGAGSLGAGVAATRLLSWNVNVAQTGAVGGAIVGLIAGAVLGATILESAKGAFAFSIPGAFLIGAAGFGAGLVAGSWLGWIVCGAVVGLVVGAVVGFLIGD